MLAEPAPGDLQQMPWIQIKIRLRTGTEHDELVIEKASSLLTGQGAMSVTYTDAGDNPVYEPLPGETKLWSETIVTGLFDAEVKTGRIMDFVKSHLRPGTQVTSEILEDKDWVREWMDHFKPMKFGRRLWICPCLPTAIRSTCRSFGCLWSTRFSRSRSWLILFLLQLLSLLLNFLILFIYFSLLFFQLSLEFSEFFFIR